MTARGRAEPGTARGRAEPGTVGRPDPHAATEPEPADAELDRAELAAAGVRPTAWRPIAVVVAAVAVWVVAWAWMRSDVDAVIVSPAVPPSRVESLEGSSGTSAPAPIPGLQDGPPKAPDDDTAAKVAVPAPDGRPSRPPPERRAAERPRPRAAPKRKRKTGRLALTSEPSGLRVRIKGGRRLGRTPLSTDLPIGAYTLLLTSKKDGISRTLDVRVNAGKRARAQVTIDKGTFQVLSRPWAEVFLNGRAVGKTPLTVEAYEGRHQLRLVSGDGAERIQRVEVKAGSNPMVRVVF